MSNNQNCIELDKIITSSQSINKQERDQGKYNFERQVAAVAASAKTLNI